jgi:GNAT superfamily N-acetyltransferase
VPYLGRALGIDPEEAVRSYRPARLTEIDAILALRRLVDNSMWWDDAAFVRWRYFSRAIDADNTHYWVFVRNGEVLGGCGIEPVELVIEGECVAAVRALDIMVRPDLDGRGLGAFMNLMLLRRFPIVLVTGSNARSHQLLCRMFQHTLDLQLWKTVIKSQALFDERRRVRLLAATFAPGVDQMLRFRRAFRRTYPPAGTTIRELTGFDGRVTDLSRRCEVDGRVLVRRSAEYLNWRLIQNPRCRYRVFGALTDGRLDGYLVTRFNRARPNPRREGEVVDFLVPPDLGHHQIVLGALLQTGVEALAADGARLISCRVFDDGVRRTLEANDFFVRPDERLPFFVHAADPVVHQRLSSTAGWFVTLGDFDVE